MPWRAALLVLYLTASLAAFGGIYSWTLPPTVAGALLLALISSTARPPIVPDTRSLDRAIVVVLVAVAVQLIPLPAFMRALLSPHAAEVDHALRPDAALRDLSSGALSIDPQATAAALMLMVAVALTYFSARRIASNGGLRSMCRALGVVGAVAAVEAIVQRAVSPTLIYGLWQPEDVGGLPFGPVVNRNHFAAWLLMTSALTGGYLVTRISRRANGAQGWSGAQRLVVQLARSSVSITAALWLVTTITILAAQSRSALVGLTVAGLTLVRQVAQGWRSVATAVMFVFVAAVALTASGQTLATQMAGRLLDTFEPRNIDRLAIWRETLPILSNFPLTGTGAGAFDGAMLTYQQTHVFVPHLGAEWQFNHAHNHYLQVAVEGGLLVGVPVAFALALFIRLVLLRLREDRGELRPIRVGAVAGLVGVAAQSIWEVPLTMPAAALLAATLAAVATHRRNVH